MIRNPSKLTIAAAALALAASTAAAQRPTVGVGGGATFPVGDVGDQNGAGWHGLITMGYRPAASVLGFRLDGMYHDMGADDVAGARDLRAIALTGNLVVEMPGTAVRPYLIGGAGLYNTRFEGLESSNNLGLNAGAGLKFRFYDFDTFVEARYHAALDAVTRNGEDRSAQFVPVTFGISF